MKKTLLLMSAAVMFSFGSCNKAEIDAPKTDIETPSVNESTESIEFVAYTEGETKTTLNGLSTEWVADDEISVNNINYITKESGSKVVFTKYNEDDNDPAAPYIALYPWCMADESGDMAFFSILNDEGKYEISPDCITDALAVAYSESEAILEFKNVMSLMKFQVPEFSEEITEIRISANEPLASDILVDYNNGEPTWSIEDGVTPSKEIILLVHENGSFNPKATYYLPVLPGEKTNLTVRINGYLAATGKSITFERSRIHNVGTLPTPAPAPEPVYYNVYVCISDLGWTSVNMHIFDADGYNTEWPGEALNEYVTINGKTYYKKTIEEGTELGITYNNGKNNSNYKIDLGETITVNEDVYYRLSARGAIKVDPNDKTTFGYAIYVFDQKSKNQAPNLYTWNDNEKWKEEYGKSFNPWPGAAFVEDCYYKPADDQQHRHYYYYVIPTNLYDVQFNYIVNKKGQTSDLTAPKNLNGDLYVGYWYNDANNNGFWVNNSQGTPITNLN